MTDRCNFRCIYCMPEEGAAIAPKKDLLTYEEIVRVVRVAADCGVTKVRITGGEPLVRKDIVELISQIGSIDGIRDLSMTTNGFLLDQVAEKLAQGGLHRINISLDTLRPERFAPIARRGELASVLAGIDAARAAGLTPIKLNVVAMRGVNDDEVLDFCRLTLNEDVDVRFIELMPISWSTGDDSMRDFYALSGKSDSSRVSTLTLYPNRTEASFNRLMDTGGVMATDRMLDASAMRKLFISASEMRQGIEREFGPMQAAEVVTNGPAKSFRIDGAIGTVGFISQISSDICANCNRLRLTADGHLRPCLMADGEVDLRGPLRSGATDRDIADLFDLTVLHKPFEHRLEDGHAPRSRHMSQLGG